MTLFPADNKTPPLEEEKRKRAYNYYLFCRVFNPSDVLVVSSTRSSARSP